MKFYIAGTWPDKKIIQVLVRMLKSLNQEITLDWTMHKNKSDEDIVINALADIYAVQECDVLICYFVIPHQYKGALVELGAALAMQKKVWIIGHAMDNCTFTRHPAVEHFKDASEIVARIENACTEN